MIDVGTGDGRAVLAAARREPDTLVIGLDAVATAMAESSRRAAAPSQKGGLPNAGFVVAAAESMPADLCQVAQLVTVRLPWASLLRGCLGADLAVAAGVAGLVGPGGTLELLLAPTPRDGLDGLPLATPDIAAAATAAFGSHGLSPEMACELSAAAVAATGSTWARRLRRPATLIRLARR